MGNQSSKSHKDKYKKNVHWKSAGKGISNKFLKIFRQKMSKKRFFFPVEIKEEKVLQLFLAH